MYIFFAETWILFRKNDEGLSNVIRSAYQHYEAMEFGKKQKDIGDPDRHIKLINIAGKEVLCSYFCLFIGYKYFRKSIAGKH